MLAEYACTPSAFFGTSDQRSSGRVAANLEAFLSCILEQGWLIDPAGGELVRQAVSLLGEDSPWDQQDKSDIMALLDQLSRTNRIHALALSDSAPPSSPASWVGCLKRVDKLRNFRLVVVGTNDQHLIQNTSSKYLSISQPGFIGRTHDEVRKRQQTIAMSESSYRNQFTRLLERSSIVKLIDP